MCESPDELERRMLAGRSRQVEQYELALRLIDAVAAGANYEAVNNNLLPALQEALREADRVGRGLTEDQAAWRRSARHAGPELRAVLDRLAAYLPLLLEKVNHQIATLLERKARLLPEIDDFIRQRRMLTAYGRHGPRAG